MANPFNIIKAITEAYIDSTTQMQNALKADTSYQKKRSFKSEKNQNITLGIFGPKLFKQYMSHGNMDSYAPVPLQAVKLSVDDIKSIYKKYIADDETLNKYTDKIIAAIKKHYTRQRFSVQSDNIYTDITFSSFDELCDFVSYVNDALNKTFKQLPENCVNWKPFVSKFRNYLK